MIRASEQLEQEMRSAIADEQYKSPQRYAFPWLSDPYALSTDFSVSVE